jgi:type 1 glutamine amidotransferase/sugar phosphate isomerase/epimerase
MMKCIKMMKFYKLLLSATLIATTAGTAACAQADSSAPAVVRASGPRGPLPVGRSLWRVPTIVELGQFLNWEVGVPSSAFQGLTLSEAVIRIDDLKLGYVEGSNNQWVSPEIRKNLDYNLTPAELTVVKNRLSKFHVQMLAYRVDTLGPDDATRRKVFEFAKAMGVEMIVSAAMPASLPGIDKLTNEFDINFAMESRGDPKRVLAELQGLSNRVGVQVDVGNWLQNGIDPQQAVTQLRDRVMAVSLHDRSSLKGTNREMPLGCGVAGTKQLLQELYRLDVKPLFFTLNTTGDVDTTADLARSVDGFEQAVLPVLGNYMIRRSKLLAIRGAEELAPDIKQAIEAAIPRTAPVTPIKPRKLLVMDEHMGHAAIPYANYAMELMGKSTGAFEVVFSNDLDSLKYDKIRQFDAVMLNSTESDISADPAVRAGLLRFVREGGGLGGIHAASWSAAFWPEFMEMLGASQGPHRTQSATVKIDDPDSPVTKAFGSQPFTYTDEYYRMTDTGLQGAYYSRDKVHVLLSVDLAKTPDFNAGRAPFIRQDNDYAVAWIKGYGKGRVFYSTMGHTPRMFMDAKLNNFLLAAMQFILGDLPADTTPSTELDVKSHNGEH